MPLPALSATVIAWFCTAATAALWKGRGRCPPGGGIGRGTVVYSMTGTFLIAAIALVVAVIGCALVKVDKSELAPTSDDQPDECHVGPCAAGFA
jgi:hypothetical protein